MKTLYKGADLLLFEGDSGCRVLKNAYLGVDGAVIDLISAEAPREAYDAEKDMTGHLLMPGFYNCHTHSPMTLLRGIGSGLPLQRWLNEAVFPVEARLTAADAAAGCKLALMEMIAGGTVSFSDMYFFANTIAEAAFAAGIKANIARHVLCFDENADPAALDCVKESLRLQKDWNGAGDGRILTDYSIHAQYTCTERLARYYAALCREAGGNLHVHLSETRAEHEACKAQYGKTPARWFYDLGAFDCDAFAAHGVWLEEDDMALLKEKGVSVVHNPTSNMKLGSGFAKIPALLQKGINVTLGTDGAASNNNQNMAEEIHLAAILHNGYTGDAALMTDAEVLRMATINGAKLQRREHCGELKEGNRADFIAVDLGAAHLQPNLNTPALLTCAMQAADVKLTVCDGRVLYENGEFKTIDAEKALFEAAAAAKRLYPAQTD